MYREKVSFLVMLSCCPSPSPVCVHALAVFIPPVEIGCLPCLLKCQRSLIPPVVWRARCSLESRRPETSTAAPKLASEIDLFVMSPRVPLFPGSACLHAFAINSVGNFSATLQVLNRGPPAEDDASVAAQLIRLRDQKGLSYGMLQVKMWDYADY
jgi:hypothetical protein